MFILSVGWSGVIYNIFIFSHWKPRYSGGTYFNISSVLTYMFVFRAFQAIVHKLIYMTTLIYVIIYCLTSLSLFSFYRNNAISIYKDTDTGVSMVHQPDVSNNELKLWHSLGSRAERNKENNAIPAKWTSYKVIFLTSNHIFICTSTLSMISLFEAPESIQPIKSFSFRFHKELCLELDDQLQLPELRCLLMRSMQSEW